MIDSNTSLIEICGGAKVIAEASRVHKLARREVTYDAARRWKASPIPEVHWRLIMRLANDAGIRVDEADLHRLNELARDARREVAA